MIAAEPLPFEDRLQFATEELRKTYEDRGNFLSDSDVYDAAEMWTTSDLSVFSDLSIDPTDPRVDPLVADYEKLRGALFDWLEGN